MPRRPASAWTVTSSGAELGLLGDVIVKIHHPRTDPEALRRRVAAAGSPALAPYLVQPLAPAPVPTPDGRWATSWPRVTVMDSRAPRPGWGEGGAAWARCGALLAGLHRTAAPSGLPAHGGHERLTRALQRARTPGWVARSLLVPLGERLLGESAAAPAGSAVVHGDWHLGQVALWADRPRLLDIDDLGVGDPAWDLGRPAGFWAAGLLDDACWMTFVDAYRDAGGPAVPGTGDPWPALDLAARCAVFIAAVREVVREDAAHQAAARPPDASAGSGDAGAGSGDAGVGSGEAGAGSRTASDLRRLLTACARM